MTPAALVDEYQRLLATADLVGARRLLAPDVHIRYVGDRAMHDPAECAAFNARRYRWVRRRVEATETVTGGLPRATVVYSRGTLFGEWADGTPFDGLRFVDRYVVCNGLITQMDAWNDGAERLLDRVQATAATASGDA